MAAPRANRPALDDIARMWRYARARGIALELKSLHRPALWRSLAAVGLDWGLIFAAFALVLRAGWLAVPPALLVMGNRQRALGNLLHDAAHGSFAFRRDPRDLVARLVLFWPMATSIKIYRREHFAHHRRLGEAGHDVDLIHRETDMGGSPLGLWWREVANGRNWRASVAAHAGRASALERTEMMAWWGALLALLGVTLSPAAAAIFASMWLASRATVFHAITTFREICDHVGLYPGSVMGFSRNITVRGPLAALFHPHHNGYHLTHHLNPALPFFALPRAHELLLGWPEYAAAAHVTRYFGGDAAIKSWVRAGT